MDEPSFEELQRRLVALWPTISPRSMDEARTIVVVSSVNFEVPQSAWPVIPAYEERFLFFVLALLGQPTGRVVYVTSQPVLPRLVDYFVSLVPGVDADTVRSRVSLVSVGDATRRPLTDKIVERPLLLERIRRLVPDPERALIMPFSTTHREVRLAELLGIPVYGPSPHLAVHGTKSGSRKLFREAGIALPAGHEDVASRDDVVAAIEDLLRRRPGLEHVVVKLDDSISGAGNAMVEVGRARDRADVLVALDHLQAIDSDLTPDEFLAALATRGGIVEERVTGEQLTSPSVQLRVSPMSDVEVLSTHDQVLGGPAGQVYYGCRFPAQPAYGPMISADACRVGHALADKGMLGRFGIDFVVAKVAGEWRSWAIEINLRNGGTTHPMLTLIALTQGDFDPDLGEFRTPAGASKHYVATDHLDNPAYRALTPDDVIDLTREPGLGWDHESQTGVALHLVSAVATAGRLGATAIADSPAAAAEVMTRATALLDRAAGS